MKDIYLGKTFTVKRDKNVIRPAPGKRECNCKQKVVTKSIGPGMFQQYTKRECEKCDNVKYVREIDEINVTVEAGMKDGQEITFFEEGEPIIDGDAGDLIFVVRVIPDLKLRRSNNDLHLDLVISLVDALVGFKKEIEHLDGHKVTIESNEVISPGQVMKIPKEGMPFYDSPNKKGSLFVKFTVSFPKSVSEQQKKELTQMLGQASWQHDEL